MTTPPSHRTGADDDARKRDEIEFHDQREIDRTSLSAVDFAKKYPNKGFYRITRRSYRHVLAWMDHHCPDAIALDYCCGLGSNSVEMAKRGATVHGIDISPQEIRTAKARAENAGVAARCHFQVMDAEHTSFPDHTFDVIVCSGVLHHIDLNRAYPELARILKPDGAILCVEAMRHNPVIQWYRRRTPHLRTAWEVDHILGVPDIIHAKRYFGRVHSRFFHLFTIPAIWVRGPLFPFVLRVGEVIDSFVLRLPGIRRMAWQAVFELSRPR